MESYDITSDSDLQSAVRTRLGTTLENYQTKIYKASSIVPSEYWH